MLDPTSQLAHSKHRKVQPNAGGHNKFEPVDSKLLPANIPMWIKASRKVGTHFNPNVEPRFGVGRGYVLPEPAMIAGLSHGNTCQSLKVGIVETCLLPDEWRSILGLEHFQTTKGTHAQTKCMKTRQDLEAVYKQKTVL